MIPLISENSCVAGRLEGHRRHDTAADPNEDRPDEPAVIREPDEDE